MWATKGEDYVLPQEDIDLCCRPMRLVPWEDGIVNGCRYWRWSLEDGWLLVFCRIPQEKSTAYSIPNGLFELGTVGTISKMSSVVAPAPLPELYHVPVCPIVRGVHESTE